jgi:hypothetical protein
MALPGLWLLHRLRSSIHALEPPAVPPGADD